jgi:integrase
MARRLWVASASLPPSAPVFPTVTGGHLRDENVRKRVLIPTGHRVDLEWVTFHTFRHTCASLLFEAGKDIKQVSGWLGHADAGFTLGTYIHLMDDGLGTADVLDRLVGANKVPTRASRQPPNPAEVGAAKAAV